MSGPFLLHDRGLQEPGRATVRVDAMTRSTLFRLPAVAGLAFLVACSGLDAHAGSSAAEGMDRSDSDPAAVITAETFRARLYFLASDALQGRDTPSHGLEVAATWLASEHQKMGLLPGAEGGSYYQRWPFRLVGTEAEAAEVRFQGAAGTVAPTRGSEAAFRGGSAAPLDAELVFVGLSPTLPAPEGIAGKAVVIRIPGGATRAALGPANRAAQWAQQGGAAAVVAVLDAPVTADEMRAFAAETPAASWRMGWEDPIPQIYLPRGVAVRAISGLEAPLARAAASPDFFVEPLPGTRLTGSVPSRLEVDARPANVVAVIPGRDPVLRDEYIVLSAHYDHVGIGRPVDGDSIYNGADDNGSGTVALLEVARAISGMAERPRRSVMFVHVSGEEKGLLGSRWFVDNSPIPVERMVANINADMVAGNAHPDTLVVIGKDYSDMGALVDSINAAMPQGLITSDDLWPEQRFFFRSDQLNFMRREIPSLFFFTGVHECYHRPCDTVDFVDHEKGAKVSRLLTHTVLALANRDARPRWIPEGLEEVRRLTGQGR